MIKELLVIGITYLLMAIFHELGHYVMIKRFKGNVEKVGILNITYSGCEKYHDTVIVIGLITGVIPLIIADLIFNINDYIIILLFLVYIYGCVSDIKQLSNEISEI